MKLKLRNALLVLGLAVPLLVYPIVNQAAEPTSKTVPEAELKALFSRYSQLKSLSVDFQQIKTLKDIPTKLASQGHLDVVAPNSLIWTVTKPSFLEFKLVGGDAQITSGKGADANVQKFTKAQMASSAQAKSLDGIASWLKFDPTFLTKEYSVTKNADGSLNFTPHKLEESPFSSIQLSFAKEAFVKRLRLSEKSGDLIEIEFEKPVIVSTSGAKAASGTKK